MVRVNALATIEAIDHESRTITVRVKSGNDYVLHAGPDIKVFDQFNVGDTMTFNWTVPVVYEIHRTGESGLQSGSENSDQGGDTGQEPGGTPTKRQSTTVTVRTIERRAPWVIVETEDGRTIGLWVEKKKILKGVNPGDRVVMTYQTAEMISVE